MSTRKIEGWASSLAEIGDDTTYSVITEPPSDGLNGWTPATLIIGGKGDTKEEHEAEFQRRVKLLVKEMLEAGTHNEDGWLTVRRQEILGVLDRNEIKLP